MRWLICGALVVACNGVDANEGAMDASAEVDSGNDSVAADAGGNDAFTATESAIAIAERRLTGQFDSTAQAARNPAFRSVLLRTCSVAAPALGDRVLYVEQTVAEQPTQPYRQRLYVLEAREDGTVVSHVWQARVAGSAARLVGLCDRLERVVEAGLFEEREGCAVVLHPEGELLRGGTEGTGCESTLMGASYATSEVELRDDQIRSWDRGFDTSGAQVWGAVEGPYEFLRVE